MNFPKLFDHPEVKAAADRLRELKAEKGQLELLISDIKSGKVQEASLEDRAAQFAAGVELPEAETDQSVEMRLERAKARHELVDAACGVQIRKLAEVRERVGNELSQTLRPQFEPVVNEIAKCVTALTRAIQKHRDFAEAMTAAGLPWVGTVPLGGTYKCPGLMADFGAEGQEFCYAGEFFETAKEFGYLAERKEVKRAVSA